MDIWKVRDRQNFAIYLAGLALVVALASFGRSPNPSANENNDPWEKRTAISSACVHEQLLAGLFDLFEREWPADHDHHVGTRFHIRRDDAATSEWEVTAAGANRDDVQV